MIHVTEYDSETGEFLLQYSYPNEEYREENRRDHQVDGTYDGGTHYILDGEPTERPASPVTRTDLTLHDVPNGATLFINGESYPAEGEVELEFPMAGIYQLRVECFPFLDWNDEVTV